MVSKLNSLGLFGINAFNVEVEASLSKGMPSFDIVGLADTAVRESRERVKSAIKNCGYEFPLGVITINLAPANIKKIGSIYDLPIFISIINLLNKYNLNSKDCSFIGELSLTGEIRPINGVLPMCIKAKESGFKYLFVPYSNAKEASVVKGINVLPVKNVNEVLSHLTGKEIINPATSNIVKNEDNILMPDFSQVKGQASAKRALEVAASGGHNIMLIGSPGSGKSMLAKRLPSILPDMTFEEMIETTKIYSIAGELPNNTPLISVRPFRSPHHTISPAGLSGGGSTPLPGELSLAHNGVLFLDELPEFGRGTMEVLRQPIEDGSVTISRVSGSLTYPCSVMLVAAMNPCPCGYFGHPKRHCSCSSNIVNRYLAKVSGPLLDRLDLHIEVPPVEFVNLNSTENLETSLQIKQRVNKAREIQNNRFKDTNVNCNANITPSLLYETCKMSKSANNLLKSAFDKMGMSARAYDRILKVSRTIADLDQSDRIEDVHIMESVRYRTLDRKYWNKEL